MNTRSSRKRLHQQDTTTEENQMNTEKEHESTFEFEKKVNYTIFTYNCSFS